MIYRAPGFDPLVGIPFALGTFYMGGSVLEYRKRILTRGRYPWTLRTFQVFYWTGVIGILLLFNNVPILTTTGLAIRIAWLVIVSAVYSPIDLLSRLYVFLRLRKGK